MLAALVRDRIQIVWLILVVATLISWGLGTSVPGNPHVAASIAILVVAFVKVRLIGRYFMELRRAPRSLRILFDGYCFLLCAVLIGVFVSLQVYPLTELVRREKTSGVRDGEIVVSSF